MRAKRIQKKKTPSACQFNSNLPLKRENIMNIQEFEILFPPMKKLTKRGSRVSLYCKCCGQEENVIEVSNEEWDEFYTLLTYLKLPLWKHLKTKANLLSWDTNIKDKWELSATIDGRIIITTNENNSIELLHIDGNKMLLNGIEKLTHGKFNIFK